MSLHPLLARSRNYRRPAGRLVLDVELVAALRAGADGYLYGRRHGDDDGPLFFVDGLDPGHGALLGLVAGRGEVGGGELTLDLGDPGSPPRATLDGRPLTVVVRDPARYRDRLAALPGIDGLVERRALIVGLGSVGSLIGERLARLGVAVMGFDPDHVTVENLVRWGLLVGPPAVGWSKARQFRETLLAQVPGARVETAALDVVVDGESFVRRARAFAPHLLVAATDTADSRRVVNALAAELGLPALYVALADGAASLRVEIVEDAAKGPCHLCAEAGERALEATIEEGDEASTVAALPAGDASHTPYGAAAAQTAVAALPVDVGLGALIAARLAIALLAGEDWRPFLQHGRQQGNVLFVSLRPDTWVFAEAWQRLVYAPSARPECPVCGDANGGVDHG